MKILTSTKIAVLVMIVIAILSLIGAIIPQGKNADFYRVQFGEPFCRLILSAGFDSIFKQTYFVALLGFLGLMLLACTIKRLRREIASKEPPFIESIEGLRNLRCHHEVRLELDRQETTLHMIDILKRKFYTTKVKSLSDSDLIYASKFGFARYGSSVLHFGLALLVLGGMVIARFGERSTIQMHIGESYDFALKDGDTLSVTLSDFNVDLDREGRPIGYLCELEILSSKGRSWETIEVNKPFKHRGAEIYLESYRPDPSFAAGYVVSVFDKDGNLVVPSLYLPCDQFVESEAVGLTLSAQRAVVPAVLAIDEGGDLRTYPIYGDLDEAMEDTLPMKFVMIHQVPSLCVSLQFVKEPGEFLIILGLAFILAGTFTSLFLSHRRIWIIVTDEKLARSVSFGGCSSKDQQSFLKEFESIKATVDELL